MKCLFRTYKLIKIPGKSSFDELTLLEVSEMIAASMIPDGNRFFSDSALYEFLDTKLKSVELIAIRDEIARNIYLPSEPEAWKEVDTDYLDSVAKRLNSIS